jgi:hypothetical protein
MARPETTAKFLQGNNVLARHIRCATSFSGGPDCDKKKPPLAKGGLAKFLRIRLIETAFLKSVNIYHSERLNSSRFSGNFSAVVDRGRPKPYLVD